MVSTDRIQIKSWNEKTLPLPARIVRRDRFRARLKDLIENETINLLCRDIDYRDKDLTFMAF